MRMRGQAPGRDEPARPGPGDPPARRGGVETVLALHRSAGNRAVSELVARAPAPDAKGATAAGPRAVLSGIGTIPLLSVSFPPSGPGGAKGSGEGEEGQPPARELVVTSRVGDHSAALVNAAGDGRAMEVE